MNIDFCICIGIVLNIQVAFDTRIIRDKTGSKLEALAHGTVNRARNEQPEEDKIDE